MPLRIVPWVATALLLPCQIAEATPTVRGLQAQDPSAQTDLYTDTGNTRLLYVTPPKVGKLRVTKSSFAVDEETCKSVAAINRIRTSELATRSELLRQQLAVEEYRTTLIRKALEERRSPEELQRDLAAFDKVLLDIQVRLTKVETDSAFAAVPPHLLQSAGYYAFVASAPWAEAISQVQSANPGVAVNRIPTSNVKVLVSVIDADSFQPNELIADVNTGNIANLASVVDGIQVDVEPTKIGACFMKFPHVIGTQADAYAFGVTINYTHRVAVTTSVRAVYNLKDVYTYLEKTGRSGGLFSSKSWSEVTEDRRVDEIFQLEIEFEQDVGPEAAEIERKRVREYMLGHAVSDMTARLVPAGDPGQSGAAIAADTLTKTCGINSYCAGVAAGLTILDGIFGRSGSSSSLVKTLEINRTYNSKVTEAVEIPGAISFVVEF